MNLNDDWCPSLGYCRGCGSPICPECGTDYRETASGYICGDCQDEEAS